MNRFYYSVNSERGGEDKYNELKIGDLILNYDQTFTNFFQKYENRQNRMKSFYSTP